jgi:4-hydroxybenzoate polyprenyltransferase
MSEAHLQEAAIPLVPPRTSDLRFLLQVSRPGLWSTTALFYLMPLGRANNLYSPRLWLGLIFVLFPLSFLLYGVNDIADAEADQRNPRKPRQVG